MEGDLKKEQNYLQTENGTSAKLDQDGNFSPGANSKNLGNFSSLNDQTVKTSTSWTDSLKIKIIPARNVSEEPEISDFKSLTNQTENNDISLPQPNPSNLTQSLTMLNSTTQTTSEPNKSHQITKASEPITTRHQGIGGNINETKYHLENCTQEEGKENEVTSHGDALSEPALLSPDGLSQQLPTTASKNLINPHGPKKIEANQSLGFKTPKELGL